MCVDEYVYVYMVDVWMCACLSCAYTCRSVCEYKRIYVCVFVCACRLGAADRLAALADVLSALVVNIDLANARLLCRVLGARRRHPPPRRTLSREKTRYLYSLRPLVKPLPCLLPRSAEGVPGRRAAAELARGAVAEEGLQAAGAALLRVSTALHIV